MSFISAGVSTGGGGGGTTVTGGTGLIDFGATSGGSSEATLAITGQSSILSTSTVQCWIVNASTATNTADDHLVAEITVMPTQPTAGVGFSIVAHTNFRLNGTFNVAWLWF
jgi:hypothetical protein